MASESVIVSLPEIIDIAVGPPEINLKLLHSILHVIVSQINLSGVRVQFKNKTALTINDLANRKTSKANKFTVYDVKNSNKNTTFDINTCTLTLKEEVKNIEIDTLVVVQPQQDAVATAPKQKQDIVAGSLPSSSVLHKESQIPGNQSVVQMIDMLNVTKRLESAELAIEKISSLICQLSNESKTFETQATENIQELRKNLTNISIPVAELPCLISRITELEVKTVENAEQQGAVKPFEKEFREKLDLLESYMEDTVRLFEFEELSKLVEALQMDMEEIMRRLQELEANSTLSWESIKAIEIKCNQAVVDMEKLETIANNAKAICTENAEQFASIVDGSKTIKESIPGNEIEGQTDLDQLSIIMNFEKYDEEIGELKEELKRTQVDLQELTCVVEDLVKCSEHVKTELQFIATTFEDVKQSIFDLNTDVNMLVREREARFHQYGALIEQIEQIKCAKVNREEFFEIVAVKADIIDVSTKVEFADFENVTRDLNLSLRNVLEQIVETNVQWHKAVDAIHLLLNEKLTLDDGVAIDKEFTAKLFALKDKLRSFGMFRLSCEAAATSQKYIKDVKCITCNAQTYINPEETLPMISKLGNFGRKIVKDAAQFADITVPCSHNVSIKNSIKTDRFCGGEHTRTRADERTSRKGDFLEQTGAVPLVSNSTNYYATGADGVLYRVDPVACNCK